MTRGFVKLISSALLLAFTVSACGTSNFNYENFARISSSDTQPDWGKQVDKLPGLNGIQKVTLLSYLGFDNNKGNINDRNEIPQLLNFQELSGSGSQLNFLVQTDGTEDKDVKRYYIVNDKDSAKIASPYIQLPEEQDTANPQVLQDFLKWGFSTYKSSVKMLDIDSHGGAYMGIIQDQESGNIMPLSGVAKAIKGSVGKVDILNFDACLMSSIEVGYELKDAADIMIGSEDSTLRTGMLYAGSLSDIIAGSRNNEELAIGMLLATDRHGVKDYDGLPNPKRPHRSGKTPNVFTISAFRGKEMKNVANDLNNLAKLLLAKISVNKSAVSSAINGTKILRINNEDIEGQHDLYEVLNRMNTIFTDPALKNAVVKTRNSLNKAIIISRSNNLEKFAQGMAINTSPTVVQSEIYQNTGFARETQWDELIVAINK